MKNLLIVLLSITFVACNNNSSTTNAAASEEGKYDAMASALCDCWKPFADLTNRADALIAAKDTEALTKLSESWETVEDDVDDCLEKLSDKYGDIEDDNEKIKLQAALTKRCPKIAELVEQAEAEVGEF